MGELLQLLFPERCVGCSRASGLMCRLCSREWGRDIRNVIDGVELTSAAYYSTSISHIVVRAKENNDSRARTVLANAISSHMDDHPIIVPIPSSHANNRRRGYDHSYLLAQQVARLTGGTVWRALDVNRRIKDQTQLAHSKRFTNLAGSYSFVPGNAFHDEVVLIDDLVTTGASMREAIRVLRCAHVEIGAEIPAIRAISACIASHHLPNTISP